MDNEIFDPFDELDESITITWRDMEVAFMTLALLVVVFMAATLPTPVPSTGLISCHASSQVVGSKLVVNCHR